MSTARVMLVAAGTTVAVDGPVLVDLATPGGQAWLAAQRSAGLDAIPETSPWSWAPGRTPPPAEPAYDAQAWQQLAAAETLGDVRDAASQAGI